MHLHVYLIGSLCTLDAFLPAFVFSFYTSSLPVLLLFSIYLVRVHKHMPLPFFSYLFPFHIFFALFTNLSHLLAATDDDDNDEGKRL